MKNRRSFLLAMTSGLVAMAVIVGPVIADELLGVITKVDVTGKKVTVVEKESKKEVEVTITDDTEYVTKKRMSKVDLTKLEKNVKKAQDAGKEGLSVKVEHEKGVASKIYPGTQKKAQ